MASPMTRAEFIRQIAYEYAVFDADITARYGAEQKRQPLEREFAFHTGRGYVRSGQYRPRVSALDYTLIAREARKLLPRMQRDLAEFGEEVA